VDFDDFGEIPCFYWSAEGISDGTADEHSTYFAPNTLHPIRSSGYDLDQ
jgi:hypothetical protein